MPHDPYRALYLHVPFCVKRCSYCDFTTSAVAADNPRIDAYVEDLCLAIRRKSKEGEALGRSKRCIWAGVLRVISGCRGCPCCSTRSRRRCDSPDVECSMEANPESLTPNMVRDIWALGVNRLSIGVQSFDDKVLETIGRAHDAQAACRAIEAAHERFTNVSCDLMCGIPGQSAESFERSVSRAIELGVSHISVYPLTIEPHTPFDRMVLSGELPERR